MTAFDIQHFTFSNQIKKENVSACHEPLKDFDFVVIYCPILTAKIIYFLSFSIFLLFKRWYPVAFVQESHQQRDVAGKHFYRNHLSKRSIFAENMVFKGNFIKIMSKLRMCLFFWKLYWLKWMFNFSSITAAFS